MARIIIGGDVCPSGNIENSFKDGYAKLILNDLFPVISEHDWSVINLECPLITKETPIQKDGRVLGASIDCVNGLKSAGIRSVNLANNHILDHGAEGLKTTLDILKENNIKFFGAGENIHEAKAPLVHKIENKTFAFWGIAEHEFSITGENDYGANPIDIIQIVKDIRKYKKQIDHIIFLVHGGKEYYHYPSPKLQKLCRFLIEEGADAVICQHSHCAGSYERYMDKLIVYGQGNFIFEPTGKKSAEWHEGFLVSLDFSEPDLGVSFIPYYQSKGFVGTRGMDREDREKFLNKLAERKKNVENLTFIEHKWGELCLKNKYLYISKVLGHNRGLRFLNKKIHFTDWLYSKSVKMMVRNVVECEVHREVLETIWKINK